MFTYHNVCIMMFGSRLVDSVINTNERMDMNHNIMQIEFIMEVRAAAEYDVGNCCFPVNFNHSDCSENLLINIHSMFKLLASCLKGYMKSLCLIQPS